MGNKVETTENYHRVPVKRKNKDDVIRTIDISKEEGIKALYAAKRKVILTYLFQKSKWTLKEAKRWVEQNKINQNYMKKKEGHIKGYVKEVKKDGTLTAVIASDETKDRHGDVLKADGWKLENFKRNPVIQWAHDPTVPAIGKVEEIEVSKGKLMFKPRFAVKASKKAKEVYELYKEGILNAFSVGYRELERDAKGDTTEMELLEISAVNVPANPNALVLAKQKGLNTDLIEEPKDDEKEESYKCQCLDCGHKFTSEKHCRESKCPECGSTDVRRANRPSAEAYMEDIDKKLDKIENNVQDLADGFKHLEPKKKQGREERLEAEVSEVLRTAQGVDKVNESLIKKLKGLLNE